MAGLRRRGYLFGINAISASPKAFNSWWLTVLRYIVCFFAVFAIFFLSGKSSPEDREKIYWQSIDLLRFMELSPIKTASGDNFYATRMRHGKIYYFYPSGPRVELQCIQCDGPRPYLPGEIGAIDYADIPGYGLMILEIRNKANAPLVSRSSVLELQKAVVKSRKESIDENNPQAAGDEGVSIFFSVIAAIIATFSYWVIRRR